MKKVLISACLIGVNVKYDGTNKDIRENTFIKKLLNLNLLIPICLEMQGGLPTPRIPVELVGKKAINKIGEDKTREFELGAIKTCEIALSKGVKLAILKSRSPSCGKGFIYDGSFTKNLIMGDGMSASLLKKFNIMLFSEEELESAHKFWKTL